MSEDPPAAPASSEQEPTRRRRPLLTRPLLYALLLAFYVLASVGGWLPAPMRPAASQEELALDAMSLEDLMREPVEVSFGVALARLPLLILGAGLLAGYVLLRSFNIRVFPRCEFPMVPWDGWHLLRCAIVYLVVGQLVGAGVAWVEQLQRARPAWAGLPYSVTVAAGNNVAMVAMCLFVVALVAGGGGSPSHLLGLREQRPGNRAALGVTAFVMIYPLLFLATLVTVFFGPLVGIPLRRQELIAHVAELPPWGFLVLTLSAVVVASVTEELLFRGFFYATLRRHMGPLAAIVLSATTFSLLHNYPAGFLWLFVLGFLLAYLYERTGSLAASIAAHAAHNLYNLVAAYLVFRPGSL